MRSITSLSALGAALLAAGCGPSGAPASSVFSVPESLGELS
jgi:hypothetical protein